MQSRLLLLAVFVLSKAQGVMGLGYSCLKWRLDNTGQTRVTFLREEQVTGARSLYLSVWSGDARLVRCDVTGESVVTERYRARCGTTEGPQKAPRFNVSALLAPDGPCARVNPTAPTFSDGGDRKARRKRAWILPGTLWCGRGSEAVRYEQLGEDLYSTARNGKQKTCTYCTVQCPTSFTVVFLCPVCHDNNILGR